MIFQDDNCLCLSVVVSHVVLCLWFSREQAVPKWLFSPSFQLVFERTANRGEICCWVGAVCQCMLRSSEL